MGDFEQTKLEQVNTSVNAHITMGFAFTFREVINMLLKEVLY